MTKAMAEERLAELQQHHRKLDVEVRVSSAGLTYLEQQQMIDLKKEKLRAKDRIASLQRE